MKSESKILENEAEQVQIESTEIESESTETDIVTSEMKLTDLNDDCFEKICRYLNLPDLLNMADTNVNLNCVAGMAYAFKYGRSSTLHFKTVENMFGDMDEIGYRYKINDVNYWKQNYQIVRSFGYMMSRMEIDIETQLDKISKKKYNERLMHLFSYIAKYCGESLNVLTITNFPDRIGKKWEYKFPELKHFILSMRFTNEDTKNLLNNYAQFDSFLRLHPQLISLKTPFIPGVNFLQTINNCVPNLQELAIYRPSIQFNMDDEIVQFKHIKKLTIESYSSQSFLIVPFQFDELEEFSFTGYWSDVVNTFLSQNSSIKKLTMNLLESVQINGLPMPNVRVIDLSFTEFKPNVAYQFINEFQHLEKFQFTSTLGATYEDSLIHSETGCKYQKIIKKEYLNGRIKLAYERCQNN